MNKNIRLMLLVCLSGLAVSSCKSHKQIANSYKYLITEDKGDEAIAEDNSKSTNSNVTITKIKVIQEAESYLGTPYRYGGINQNGIDCSGLTQKSYLVTGLKLPRSAKDQSEFGLKVERNELQPGDLVFFSAKNTGDIDHVGLVTEVDGDQVVFIHASTSNGVRYDQLNEGYWKNLFKIGRRVGEGE